MNTHYPYLIIGGGMTGASAIQGIREVDPQGEIGLISAESNPPYDRPPLSKGLWTGKKHLEKIWRDLGSPEAKLHLGRKITSLNPAEKKAVDDQGDTYTYNKLLLATGGQARRLPFGGEDIIYFRTFEDYGRLRALAGQNLKFLIIGAGFIGSEVAAALAMIGEDVSMIFPDEGIGTRIFPPTLAQFISRYYQEKGVRLIRGEKTQALERRGDHLVLKTESGQEYDANALVAGIGLELNTGLAKAAGLQVDNGICVDENLRTNQPDIYAAGDIASFFNPALNRRMRVEHEDNANVMGRTAGQNMAGRPVLYHHLPYFYSDLFDLGYEAVGELNPQLEVVADWQELYRKGVLYYLKEGRVHGVLLWDVWDQVEAARRLISEPGPFKASSLMGRLPE